MFIALLYVSCSFVGLCSDEAEPPKPNMNDETILIISRLLLCRVNGIIPYFLALVQRT